ncbi:MAG: N-acetyltransferase [Aulosira sp. DedQUE10]|nr:N-acetyltransferase [Aulosira sp. DedQUE10]
MNIRSEIITDYTAISEVNTRAFGQRNEARLVEEIRNSERYIPELSLVAEIEDLVVGHILFSYIDLVGEQTLQILGLAPMAVLPDFQRQGVGSALVQAGLEIANTRKEAIVIVLGHPHFYTRFGFKPSVNYAIESPFSVPEDFFMVKALRSYQESFKGKVVYPPAFETV